MTDRPELGTGLAFSWRKSRQASCWMALRRWLV